MILLSICSKKASKSSINLVFFNVLEIQSSVNRLKQSNHRLLKLNNHFSFYSSNLCYSTKNSILPNKSLLPASSLLHLFYPDNHSIMTKERNKLIVMDMALFAIEPKLSDNLEKIRKSIIHIEVSVSRYDFNDKLPGNGYRSLIKLMGHFARLAYADVSNKSFSSVSPCIVNMSTVFACLFNHLDETQVLKQSSLMWPPDCDFIQLAFTFEPFISSFYSRNHNFWLAPSLRSILSNYISLIAYKSVTFCDMYRIFSRANVSRLFADYALNVSIGFVRSIWGMTEWSWYKKLYPMLLYGTRPARKKTIYAPRQGFARLTGFNGTIDFDQNKMETWDKANPVRFRFLQDTKNDFTPNTLVFHIHGAGFVAQSPESHEIYLRDWAIKLKGIPLVSVDYRLAPEHKYPIGLQDCLDLYLWLTSGLDEVRETIGFHPKRLILCGDSAGGGLCISLTLALNELRTLTKVSMPSSLIPFYPVCCLQTCASPSRLLTFFDTFLPLGVLLAIADAYFYDQSALTSVVTDKNSSDKSIKTPTKRPSTTATKTTLPTGNGPHSMRPPWYKQPGWKERLERINQKAADPFATTLNYQNFSTLKDVSLNIVVGEFDPLLDEAIEFAKKWKGPVYLDIIPNVSHGFLYFANVSTDCRVASDLCFKRITEAVNFPQAKI